MIRIVCHAVVILAACLVTAAKLRHQGAACPLATTQEVNRCLSLLRAASERRGPSEPARRYSVELHDR
jgi:hypothetical protein